MGRSFGGEARAALSARLNARRAEIEQAIVARVYAISDPRSEARDADYLAGLRGALTVALDYGLAVIERGEEHAPAVPPALLVQARLAARTGIGLDTLLRRYLAGYSLLSEFVIQEAERSGLLQGAELQQVLRGQAAILDRLIAAVSEEHMREANGRPGSTEQRRAERIERLLAGEFLDTSGLAYDFDAHHVGVIAAGPGPAEAVRRLAAAADRRLLLLNRSGGAVWAWLGGRNQLSGAELDQLAASQCFPGPLAIGEPGHGTAGWRLTHQQAVAAFAVARRRDHGIVRYADVALLASILHDDLLATSLRKLYLEPLDQERDGGTALRDTLRAWFAADRNVSSTAAALGVERHTVSNRLRLIERRLGGALGACALDLEVALRLENLSTTIPAHQAPES